MLDQDFDAASLHLLRARVTACAAAAGMPAGRASDVTLAMSELAANIVRHGPGQGHLQIDTADGALRCLVSDTGPGTGPWPVTRGHGLWIVREVADTVTFSCCPRGSLVTAIFAVPR